MVQFFWAALCTINIIQKGQVAKLNLNKKSEVSVTKNKKGKLSLAAKKGEVKVNIGNKEENFKENE